MQVLVNADQVHGCAALRRGRFKLVRDGDCGYPPERFGAWEQPGQDFARRAIWRYEFRAAEHVRGRGCRNQRSGE